MTLEEGVLEPTQYPYMKSHSVDALFRQEQLLNFETEECKEVFFEERVILLRSRLYTIHEQSVGTQSMTQIKVVNSRNHTEE